ncbi:MAG: hypothetical protein E6Q67_02800 [Roseateles sp.]|nr:MAG: hypothetical protein E6Q67_02800 [Roseateles sp.]
MQDWWDGGQVGGTNDYGYYVVWDITTDAEADKAFASLAAKVNIPDSATSRQYLYICPGTQNVVARQKYPGSVWYDAQSWVTLNFFSKVATDDGTTVYWNSDYNTTGTGCVWFN